MKNLSGADFLASPGRWCPSQSSVNNTFQAVLAETSLEAQSGSLPLSQGLMPLLLQHVFSLWMPFLLLFAQTCCEPIARVASGVLYKTPCNPCSHVIPLLPADWITTKCCGCQLAGASPWSSLWSSSFPSSGQDLLSPSFLHISIYFALLRGKKEVTRSVYNLWHSEQHYTDCDCDFFYFFTFVLYFGCCGWVSAK